MKSSHPISLVVAALLFFAFGSVVMAQTYTPDVQVAGTGIVDGAVTIAQATVEGPAWAVIHADADGKPGPVIGYAPLAEGVNENVAVEIDSDAATPIMHAMLHVDEGEVGTFEFPGPDGPVKIGDAIVMARFSASPVVEAEAATDAPESVPDTGAGTTSPLLFAGVAVAFLALGAGAAVTRSRA